MTDLKYIPETHDHNAFLDKAKKRESFKKAYEDLEAEYVLAGFIFILSGCAIHPELW